MKKISPTIWIVGLMMLPFVQACKTSYSTVSFEAVTTPKAPDYSQVDSWAVLPEKQSAGLQAVIGDTKPLAGVAVFFLYPTLFTDPKEEGWNADIYTEQIRKGVDDFAVKYQASAWAKSGRLFVPYYRQTHYRVFVPPYDQKGRPAWELSYADIKAAFEYYLTHHNQGNGIIIASHSQGTLHAKRLVREYFDGKPLQKQLVAAYLVGARIQKDEFENIKPMEQPESIGGFVSWNTYKKNRLPKKYETWFQGGVTSNPIRWDNSNISLEHEHKGILNRDLKIYPQSISVKKTDGILWATVPKIPSRFFLSFIKNYHFADINLFWKDISVNAELRAQGWLAKYRINDAH